LSRRGWGRARDLPVLVVPGGHGTCLFRLDQRSVPA